MIQHSFYAVYWFIMISGIAKTRFQRLLWLIQEIRNDPKQDLKSLCERIGISRSQFYKDRDELIDLGFEFTYHNHDGFRILRDKLSPISHLTLSETLVLMFGLKNLCASGDGHLVLKALETGRKLAAGLEEPFRTQVIETFDKVVITDGYGCKAAVLKALQEAILNAERIQILYRTGTNKDRSWRTVDPKRLYFVQRALYLYAAVPQSNPAYKTYRASRISDVRSTGLSFIKMNDNDGFYGELNNAFSAFIGPVAREVTIKFHGDAAAYVKETLWHHSQEIEQINENQIIFKVKVAEPKEVLWWALQFGEEAEILEPKELRRIAAQTISKMSMNYSVIPINKGVQNANE